MDPSCLLILVLAAPGTLLIQQAGWVHGHHDDDWDDHRDEHHRKDG
jgi:hypothetical protein